ncbi:hypothetical protein ACWDR0_08770 [Streptomyces sp. NPDC003691]
MSERERSDRRVAATAPSAPPSSRLPGTPSGGDLPELLALVGRLLEAHSPDDIAVLLREELDRREIEAYATGWRDAAAEYGPALAEALAAARPLRLVDRTPGQAAVIPFPQDARDAPGPGPGSGDAAEVGGAERESPRGRSRRARRTGGGTADRDGGEAEAPATGRDEGTGYPDEPGEPRPRPGFMTKSRKSKVPTIPRLGGGGRRTPRGDTPPPGGPPADDLGRPGP